MDITKHATIRCQQRGISEDLIDLIFQLGDPISRPGGAMEYLATHLRRDTFKVFYVDN